MPRLRPGAWHMAVGPTLQHDRSDFPCAGARGGGFTSAQVQLCWALWQSVSRRLRVPCCPRHALWGVNTGPEHRCPSPSPPKRARRRPCPAGNSRLHPAWLETGTFSADCRGCLHMGLAWPRACRGASSPAVYLGETPAPLHGAGGWRLTLGLGLVQQRCPGSGCSVHCGAVGCGVRAGVELPPARLPDTALGSTRGRCLLLHPKASQLPPVPRRRASAVPRQPPGLWSPRACTPGAERPEAREVNTGDLA